MDKNNEPELAGLSNILGADPAANPEGRTGASIFEALAKSASPEPESGGEDDTNSAQGAIPEAGTQGTAGQSVTLTMSDIERIVEKRLAEKLAETQAGPAKSEAQTETAQVFQPIEKLTMSTEAAEDYRKNAPEVLQIVEYANALTEQINSLQERLAKIEGGTKEALTKAQQGVDEIRLNDLKVQTAHNIRAVYEEIQAEVGGKEIDADLMTKYLQENIEAARVKLGLREDEVVSKEAIRLAIRIGIAEQDIRKQNLQYHKKGPLLPDGNVGRASSELKDSREGIAAILQGISR